jgi:hypothetical protein
MKQPIRAHFLSFLKHHFNSITLRIPAVRLVPLRSSLKSEHDIVTCGTGGSERVFPEQEVTMSLHIFRCIVFLAQLLISCSDIVPSSLRAMRSLPPRAQATMSDHHFGS